MSTINKNDKKVQFANKFGIQRRLSKQIEQSSTKFKLSKRDDASEFRDRSKLEQIDSSMDSDSVLPEYKVNAVELTEE